MSAKPGINYLDLEPGNEFWSRVRVPGRATNNYSAVKSQNTVKPNPLCRLPVTSATSQGSFGEVGVMEFGLKGTSRLVADVMGSRHSGLGFTVFWLFTGVLVMLIELCSDNIYWFVFVMSDNHRAKLLLQQLLLITCSNILPLRH